MDKCSILKRLCRCRKEGDFEKVIRSAKPKDMTEVVDTLVKVLNKQIPVSKKQAKSIFQNRRAFRHLVHPQYSLKSKRRYLLHQSGGGVGAIGKVLSIASKALTRTSPVMTRSLAAATKGISKSAPNVSTTLSRASSTASSMGSAAGSVMKRMPPRQLSVAGKIVKHAKAVKNKVLKPYRAYTAARARHPTVTTIGDMTATGGTLVGASAWARSPNIKHVATS